MNTSLTPLHERTHKDDIVAEARRDAPWGRIIAPEVMASTRGYKGRDADLYARCLKDACTPNPSEN